MKKTVIVSGATGGIGEAISRLFARNGWNVAAVFNSNEKKAAELVAELESNGVKAVAFRCDIRSRKETDMLAEKVIDEFGNIDVLVNNAGVALTQKLFDEVNEEEYDYIFDTNVKGTFNCIQSVLPTLIHNKSGKIVNISSMWGICGGSCEVHYSASKAAIIGLTKALAKELAPSGINVNCIAPGVIDTKMNAHLDENEIELLKEEIPLGKIGSPESVAESVYFFSSEKSDYITGQTLCVDGGMVI